MTTQLFDNPTEIFPMVLREFGRMRLTDCWDEWEKYPELMLLFSRAQTLCESGSVPTCGGQWLSEETSYKISRHQLAGVRNAMKFVDMVSAKRQEALKEMLPLLVARFYKEMGPVREATRFQACILRDCWLLETCHPRNGSYVVTVECLFGFGRREKP